jgi:hypothetical protein
MHTDNKLPQAGTETLKGWSQIFSQGNVATFYEKYQSMDPQEKEQTDQYIRQLSEVLFSGISSAMHDIESAVQDKEKIKNEKEIDPLAILFTAIGNKVITPMFASVIEGSNLTEASKQSIYESIEHLYRITMPSVFKNNAEVFSPENIKAIDPYTPFSTIMRLEFGCMRLPLIELIVSQSPTLKIEFNQENHSSTSTELMPNPLSKEKAARIVDNFFDECYAEIAADDFSLATILNISHPDTLEGRYQLAVQKNDAEQHPGLEVALSSHHVQDMAGKSTALACQLFSLSDSDAEKMHELMIHKHEDQLKMRLVIAGCKNLHELEEKQARLSRLKREALAQTSKAILIQREYESCAIFIDDAEDAINLKLLFEKFEKDQSAFETFKIRHSQTLLFALTEFAVAFQRKFSELNQSEMDFDSLMDLKSIDLLLAETLSEVQNAMRARGATIIDEYEKAGFFYACASIQKIGPSVIRIELAKMKPNYKLALELKAKDLIDQLPRPRDISLSEFDQKFSKYVGKKFGDSVENLQELEYLRSLEEKSDEEVIRELMHLESVEHQELVELFGWQPMPDLID